MVRLLFNSSRRIMLLSFMTVVCVTQAFAAVELCNDLARQRVIDVLGKLATEPMEQLVTWELTANLSAYREATDAVEVKFSHISKDKVDVEILDSDSPHEAVARFIASEHVVWPKHPYNTSDIVPYRLEPDVGSFPAFFSASRSMFVKTDSGSWFSLKMGTNHPHRGERQETKADIKDDVAESVANSRYIERLDRELVQDPKLEILREVLSVKDLTTGNGYVIRDVTPLMQQGKYYIPAFALPFIGGKISQLQGEEFNSFWEKHYAQALGRSKAKLLLRYGLQMMTPNPQNMLIELDMSDGHTLKPTGKIVWRDTIDSHFVDFVARAIGQGAELDNPRWQGGHDTRLNPFADNSFWRLDIEGEHRLSSSIRTAWMKAHDQAYVDEIVQALGLESQITSISQLDTYLKSPEGQQRLTSHHQSLRRQMSWQVPGIQMAPSRNNVIEVDFGPSLGERSAAA